MSCNPSREEKKSFKQDLGVILIFLFFLFRYIENDVTRLEPEIDLLNPQEGSRRLEPLESQVSDHQNLAKSLNVEYKHNVMKELKDEAQKLDEKGQKAVEEMYAVSGAAKKLSNHISQID